jgi:hypothetical protein
LDRSNGVASLPHSQVTGTFRSSWQLCHYEPTLR